MRQSSVWFIMRPEATEIVRGRTRSARAATVVMTVMRVRLCEDWIYPLFILYLPSRKKNSKRCCVQICPKRTFWTCEYWRASSISRRSAVLVSIFLWGLISETNGFGIVLCEPATKRDAPMLFGSSSPFLKLFELGTRYLQNISLAEWLWYVQRPVRKHWE